jgi:hypothetical protein
VISHDRWFLDRVATHILAYEDDSQAVFFEGNYTEYEADRKSASAKPLPSRTGYGTRNWPDSGWWHEKAEPSGSVFLPGFFSGTELDSSLASQLPQGLCPKCGSWLASDGGVTVGAKLDLISPFRCKKAKNPPYLYPVHHLISQMRHFALFLCTSRLLKSGSNASYDKKFAETFP